MVIQLAASPLEGLGGRLPDLLSLTEETNGFGRIDFNRGGGVPRMLEARRFIMTFTAPAPELLANGDFGRRVSYLYCSSNFWVLF